MVVRVCGYRLSSVLISGRIIMIKNTMLGQEWKLFTREFFDTLVFGVLGYLITIAVFCI